MRVCVAFLIYKKKKLMIIRGIVYTSIRNESTKHIIWLTCHRLNIMFSKKSSIDIVMKIIKYHDSLFSGRSINTAHEYTDNVYGASQRYKNETEE